MANLPGARQERFTAEETAVFVRAVKDQEVALYGDVTQPYNKSIQCYTALQEEDPGLGSSAHGLSGAQGPAEEGAAKHQGAGDPDQPHAVAALSDRNTTSSCSSCEPVLTGAGAVRNAARY